jgi:transglutaminase-like putative cysteine protease
MKRYKITHHTLYSFPSLVKLQPHTLRLRPREGHELRIESSKLEIFPVATRRWHRDAEGNSVLIANFTDDTRTLDIKSEILIQQYDLAPFDFLVADYAVDYPFNYLDEDRILLLPYLTTTQGPTHSALTNRLASLWQPGEMIQSIALLQRLNRRIYQSMAYQQREEEGVQSPQQTIGTGSGSCRDFANLFMSAARGFGFAARFVSGYVYPNTEYDLSGSTHAWVEVFIPGAGWKGFDPTNGSVVGDQHIAVAVARLPESVPPVAGSYFGAPQSSMTVNVWVTDADS